MDRADKIELAAAITAAWLSNSNHRAAADDVPALLTSVAASLDGLGTPDPVTAPEVEYLPAVSVRKSLASPDFLISMIDGKPYRTLKRHLRGHGLTPDEYRTRYGLPHSYPMTAPSYSAARSSSAKGHNFGRKLAEATGSDVKLSEAAGSNSEPLEAAARPENAIEPAIAAESPAKPAKEAKAPNGEKDSPGVLRRILKVVTE